MFEYHVHELYFILSVISELYHNIKFSYWQLKTIKYSYIN